MNWVDKINNRSNKVIIFGITQTAELANYYLKADSDFEVIGFYVDKEYHTSQKFEGLPVFTTDEMFKNFSSQDHNLFAPTTAIEMNGLRKRVFEAGVEQGYSFISYVSSKSTVLTSDIGANCFLLECNTIQPMVKIGDNCIFWSGNHIGHHSVINNHNFFTSHVVLSGNCEVKERCFFGVNSTIRDFSVISEGTLIGMGACLSKVKTDPWAVYSGSPAVKNIKRKSTDLM